MLNLTENFNRALKEVEYAYERTPFYKDHFENNGMRIDDVGTLSDLSGIPPTSKMHYRKNFPIKVLSKGFTLQDERLYRTQSSGTTDERLTTLEVGLFYMKRAMETLGVYPAIATAFAANPRRHIRYAAPNCSDVECANPNSTMADRLLKDGTLVLSVYHDLLTTTERMLDANLKEITLFKPSMYYIDSTHLAHLCRHMNARNFQSPSAPLLSSYTLATQVAKRQIREHFGANTPYAEFVSMSELGWIALECPHGNLHINNKSYYIELVNHGKPASPGQLGELYITTLDNGCTPKIRYKTGDIYTLKATTCTCGCAFPVVEFHGRLTDFITRNNTILLTPRDVDTIIGAPQWLDLYQFRQLDETHYEWAFVTNSAYAAGMEHDIVENLNAALGNAVSLKTSNTTYIPTERSGKFASCLSAITKEKIQSGLQFL